MVPRCADSAKGNNETTLFPIFVLCCDSRNNKTGGVGQPQTHLLYFSAGQNFAQAI